MKTWLIGLAAFAGLVPQAADAAIVSKSLTITGAGFSQAFGSGSAAPVSPAKITFSISFDNAANIDSTTTGLNVLSTNLPTTFNYAYDHGSDMLTLATSAMRGGCGNPAGSACLFFNSFSTAPNAFFFQQSTSDSGYWVASQITTATAAVPEPATWGMMMLGLGVIGVAMRRRRAPVRVAYA
ncbi:MAG: PEP-CTERM sorting domain-containing protein [Sphingomonadales bacterium]|nr:PEP-CTERM sorting domain-containing protein [Sphingomonadales bacterium]